MGGKTIQALAHWYWYKSHIVISTGPAWQPLQLLVLVQSLDLFFRLFIHNPHLFLPSSSIPLVVKAIRSRRPVQVDEKHPWRRKVTLSKLYTAFWAIPPPPTHRWQPPHKHSNQSSSTMSCSLLYSIDFFHFTVTSYFKHPHSHVSFLNIVQIEVNDFSAVWGKDFLIFSVCTLCVFGHFVVYECGKHLNTQTAKDAVLCPFWWVDFSDECSLNSVKLKGHTQKWESHLAFPQNVVDFCPDKTHIQALRSPYKVNLMDVPFSPTTSLPHLTALLTTALIKSLNITATRRLEVFIKSLSLHYSFNRAS